MGTYTAFPVWCMSPPPDVRMFFSGSSILDICHFIATLHCCHFAGWDVVHPHRVQTANVGVLHCQVINLNVLCSSFTENTFQFCGDHHHISAIGCI